MKGDTMRKLKYLVLFLICMPVIPDISCMPLYAGEAQTQAENVDAYMSAILFFVCVLLGNRLWKAFIGSFEKGSF